MKFLSFLVGESSFSFPQFVPLGYILVRLDAVKKGLLLPCQFNLIDSLWYSGKHPHLVAVVGNVSIFLDTKWFLWAATTPLQYYDSSKGGFPLLVLVLGETRFSPVVEDDILGTFIPCKSTRAAAIKPIKSGHYRNSPCQPMECNTSRLRIRAYYVFNARTTRSDT